MRKKRLLAKEVAVMMNHHWLTVFSVPRAICSDRGPQVTGGWFKAMCSLMGIRHARSVAYISWCNGRAEFSTQKEVFCKVLEHLIECLEQPSPETVFLAKNKHIWFELYKSCYSQLGGECHLSRIQTILDGIKPALSI